MKIELKYLDEIDIHQFAYYANDKQINVFLKDCFPYPYTLQHAIQFVNDSLSQKRLEFAICVDDKCIGMIGAIFGKDIYRYNCEIGYWLSSQYWNKGIMTSIIHSMIDFIFKNYSIHKITAEVFNNNIGSSRALIKNKFKQEAQLKNHAYKNDRFEDIIIYSLRREDYEN